MNDIKTQPAFPTAADFPLGRNPHDYVWRTLEWLREQHPTSLTDDNKARELYQDALKDLCSTYGAEDAASLWSRYRDCPPFIANGEEPTGDQYRLQAVAYHALARDRREGGRRVAWPGEWLDAVLKIPCRAWLVA